MRIAAMSDIHSNYHALVAVLEDIKRLGSDVTVVVAGDFLNCGPYPRETLQILRDLNPLIIKGNHEEYVLNHSKKSQPPLPPHRALRAPSRWSAYMLNQEELAWLEKLPDRIEIDGPDGSQIVITHGSPRKIDEGITPESDSKRLSEIYEGEVRPKRLFIHGHTHRPALHYWEGMVIAGDGSVGFPVDNDTRACYLLAEWDKTTQQWKAEHRRVDYDRAPAIEALTRNSSYEEGGPFMKLMRENYITGRSCRIPWFVNQYLEKGDWEGAEDDFYHLECAVDHHLATYKDLPPLKWAKPL